MNELDRLREDNLRLRAGWTACAVKSRELEQRIANCVHYNARLAEALQKAVETGEHAREALGGADGLRP